jgi:hypothetical protein
LRDRTKSIGEGAICAVPQALTIWQHFASSIGRPAFGQVRIMRHYSTTLGTIRCPASKATVDALVSRYGLHANPGTELHHFDIQSSRRGSEPEVDSDLFDLALGTLRAAERDGALPSWSVVANHTSEARA